MRSAPNDSSELVPDFWQNFDRSPIRNYIEEVCGSRLAVEVLLMLGLWDSSFRDAWGRLSVRQAWKRRGRGVPPQLTELAGTWWPTSLSKRADGCGAPRAWSTCTS